jgi:nitrite reductase/ring-hydroxylating ferredoxin subunit
MSQSVWHVVCATDALTPGVARGFVLAGPPRIDLIVLRVGLDVCAYVNRCPHRGTPLNLMPDHFMDRSGEHLICATHGALFRPGDGHCISGPCQGDRLTRIEARIKDDRVEVWSARQDQESPAQPKADS